MTIVIGILILATIINMLSLMVGINKCYYYFNAQKTTNPVILKI